MKGCNPIALSMYSNKNPGCQAGNAWNLGLYDPPGHCDFLGGLTPQTLPPRKIPTKTSVPIMSICFNQQGKAEPGIWGCQYPSTQSRSTNLIKSVHNSQI